MRARYCKKKNTYTMEECRCDCDDYQRQGVGSLVGQSTNVITKINTERTINS